VVYVLEGEVVLRTDGGEQLLTALYPEEDLLWNAKPRTFCRKDGTPY
jgi:hypothetical protein